MAIKGSGFDTSILDNYLYLLGRASGQTLGATSVTGGSTYDFAVRGRFAVGNNLTAFVTNRAFHVAHLIPSGTISGLVGMVFTADPAVTGAAANPAIRGLLVQLTGTYGYTSGTINIIQGLFFVGAQNIPNNVNVNSFYGGLFQATPNESGTVGGTTGINNLYGINPQAWGPTTPNTAHITTKIVSVLAEASNRQKNTTYVCPVSAGIGTPIANTVGHFAFFANEVFHGLNTNFNALVTNCYGLFLGPVVGSVVPTNAWGLWVDDFFTKNVLQQPTTICGTTDPIHGTDNQNHFGWKTTATKLVGYNAAGETIIPCDATAAAFAVNLPTAVGILGRVYIIKKVDASANAVTVTPNGAETIDGAATSVLAAQWDVVRLVSNGANWLKI